jgi:RimJ/RimL family protein N-acetyltransferase
VTPLRARALRPPGVIATARLRLRRPAPEDAPAIFATWARDPEVTRYLTWRPHRSLAATREFLKLSAAARKEGRAFAWAITLKDDGRLVGMIELRPDGHRVELGYCLGRAWWGRGFMTEAVRAVADWALAQRDVVRVWAVCDVENPASARVLEKAGMAREGLLRRWSLHPNVSATPRDCWCFARVKDAG